YTIGKILELKQALDAYQKAQSNLERGASTSAQATSRFINESRQRNIPIDADFYKRIAQSQLFTLQQGDNRYLEYYLQPERQDWFSRTFTLGANPFRRHVDDLDRERGITKGWMAGDPFWVQRAKQSGSLQKVREEESGARHIQRNAPDLGIPEVMAEFRKQLADLNFPEETKARLERMLQQAFPDTYQRAVQVAVEEMQRLGPTTGQTGEAFERLLNPVNNLQPSFGRAGDAAARFANRINGLQINIPAPTYLPPNQTPGAPLPLFGPRLIPSDPAVPKSAKGSVVERDGLAEVHRGNVIFPASLSRRAPGDWLETFSSLRSFPVMEGSKFNVSAAQRPGAVQVAEPSAINLPASLVFGIEPLSLNITPTLSPTRQAEESASGFRVRAASKTNHIDKLEVNVNVPEGSMAAQDPYMLSRLLKHEIEIGMERA
ncbi:MAG: hypothetical protein ACRD9R_03990, partial [Pyrinomonadaceae bacterium]